jgi:DNA-binding response OmpR family regulator
VPEILIATDATSVYRELSSVLAAPGINLRWIRSGHDVRAELDRNPADLAIVDMQIGTMGGIAVALDIRLEADAGRMNPCPVLLTLDRRPDVFLARRQLQVGCRERIRKAAAAMLDGSTWYDTSYAPDPVAVPSSVA